MSLYDIFDKYMENEKFIDEQTVTEVNGVKSIRVKNMVFDKINSEKPKKAKKRFAVIFIAAVLSICSIIGAYAGVRGFFIKSEPDGKYGQKFSIVKGTSNKGITFKLNKTNNAKNPKYLGIRYGYVPKGFSIDNSPSSSGKGGICRDKSPHVGGFSVVLYDMSEQDEIIDYRRNIIDSELTVINGHESLYIRQKLFKKYDENNPDYDKNVYVYFKKYDCMLYVWAGTDLSKSELYKILENAELFECEESQAIITLDWQDNYFEDIYKEQTKDWNYNKIVANTDDNRFVKVGEEFTDSQPVDMENDCPVQITVNDLQLYDNFDIIGNKALNTGVDTSKYLDSKGNFKPIKVKYYGNGDGINKLDKLIATKHFNVKFLYETVTLKNTSSKNINEFLVYHGLRTKDFNAQESYIYKSMKNFKEVDFDYNNMYCLGEWVYDDFCIPDNSKSNCISIPSKGEITLHIGRFILADVAKDGINLELCSGNEVCVDDVNYLLNYTFLSKKFN